MKGATNPLDCNLTLKYTVWYLKHQHNGYKFSWNSNEETPAGKYSLDFMNIVQNMFVN